MNRDGKAKAGHIVKKDGRDNSGTQRSNRGENRQHQIKGSDGLTLNTETVRRSNDKAYSKSVLPNAVKKSIKSTISKPSKKK